MRYDGITGLPVEVQLHGPRVPRGEWVWRVVSVNGVLHRSTKQAALDLADTVDRACPKSPPARVECQWRTQWSEVERTQR